MEGMHDQLTAIAGDIARTGFAFVRAPEMRAVLGDAALRDWGGFAASWDDLGVDMFMADGGRYRRRRFACTCPDWSVRRPHIGGALGAALLDSWTKHGWVERTGQPRILRVTPAGHRQFDEFLAD